MDRGHHDGSGREGSGCAVQGGDAMPLITYISPPCVLISITAVHHIEISGNKVTLVYIDGTKQTKTIKAKDREGKDFLNLVSMVQERDA